MLGREVTLALSSGHGSPAPGIQPRWLLCSWLKANIQINIFVLVISGHLVQADRQIPTETVGKIIHLLHGGLGKRVGE